MEAMALSPRSRLVREVLKRRAPTSATAPRSPNSQCASCRRARQPCLRTSVPSASAPSANVVFGRMSGPLSSCLGEQPALKWPYRGHGGARDPPVAVKSARYHANLAAVGHSAAGTRGFLAVVFSYGEKLVLPKMLYCLLHIQKDDGQETKRVLEYL